MTQTEIDTVLATIAANSAYYDANYLFFEEDFTQTNTKSKKARSVFTFSEPIEINGVRYSDINDRPDEQEQLYLEFALDARSKVFKVDSGNLKVNYYSALWSEYYKSAKTYEDFNKIIVSFILLFAYMSFHLESLFLGFAGVGGIALTLPFTLFINRFIYQITYFGSFNLIAIFIILGIAVDDIFVFTDMWKHSAVIPHLNTGNRNEIMNKRLAFTWRKTSKAIFTTSITDCISFLATAFSNIMPIASFGFFCSTAVMVAYFLTISVFPSCIIIHESYLAKYFSYRSVLNKLYKATCQKTCNEKCVEKITNKDERKHDQETPEETKSELHNAKFQKVSNTR